MGETKGYIVLPDEKGNINISEEVVAVVAATAALETDGVAALSQSLGKDIAEILGKKNIQKGVQIEAGEDGVRADVYILARMGTSVHKVGSAVQENVSAALESITGITAAQVNVHVVGVKL